MDLGPYLKFLDIPARSAVVVVLGLSPFLYVNREALSNPEGVDLLGIGAVLIIFCLAVAILAVRFIQLLLAFFQYLGRKEFERREIQQKRDAEIDEIRKNLRTLSPLQREQLLWILRRDSERVDLPVDVGLIKKGILKSVNWSLNLVEVDPWVWEHREEIIGNDTSGTDSKFPSEARGRIVV